MICWDKNERHWIVKDNISTQTHKAKRYITNKYTQTHTQPHIWRFEEFHGLCCRGFVKSDEPLSAGNSSASGLAPLWLKLQIISLHFHRQPLNLGNCQNLLPDHLRCWGGDVEVLGQERWWWELGIGGESRNLGGDRLPPNSRRPSSVATWFCPC